MKDFVLGTTLTLCLSTSLAIADDPNDKGYLMSLFNEQGKAQSEFARVVEQNPLLSAYALTLFTNERCAVPKPSDALKKASGGDDALAAGEGKTIFIIAGVVGTMKFPSTEKQASFCDSTRRLVAEAERTAATQ